MSHVGETGELGFGVGAVEQVHRYVGRPAVEVGGAPAQPNDLPVVAPAEGLHQLAADNAERTAPHRLVLRHDILLLPPRAYSWLGGAGSSRCILAAGSYPMEPQ